MLPKSNVVKVSDPVVTGVDPVPDDVVSPSSQTEAYSEGGLSGEAGVESGSDAHKTSPPDTISDQEPFMLRQHTDEAIADYDKGFECGQSGGQNDDTKSEAWQRGWAEAQE